MMPAVVLDAGRRRAVDRDELGTMNHPMHRRPRRRPRTWNNYRRGPGDRYRSVQEQAMPSRTSNKGQPLFPFWVLLIANGTIWFGLLLWIWPTTIASGWSIRVVLASLAMTTTAVYVVGESIRCRFRISIKVLLASVALVALFCGLFVRRYINALEKRQCVREIVRAGGFVYYDFDDGWGTRFMTKEGWLLPKWTRNVLGDEFFGNVSEIWLGNGIVDDGRLKNIDPRSLRVSHTLELARSPVTDSGLAHIAALDQLRCLSLAATRITDSGLQHLSDMHNLEVLDLDGTTISDAGLIHLTDHTRLRVVTARNTKVTAAGADALEEALAACDVIR
jgi:hypothetical protein